MFDGIFELRNSGAWATGIILDSAVKGGILLGALTFFLRVVLSSATASVRYAVCFVGGCGILCLPLVATSMPQWHIPFPKIAVMQLAGTEKKVESERASDPAGSERAGEGAEAGTRGKTLIVQGHQSLESRSADPGTRGSLDSRAEALSKAVSASWESSPEVPVSSGTRMSGTLRPFRDRLSIVWIGCVGGWALGVILTLLPWLIGLVALFRLWRRSQWVEKGPWFRMLEEICQTLAIQPPRIYQTDCCRAPMASRFLWPFIILPREARLWSKEKMYNVLIHELGHLKRHDDLTYLPVRLMASLHWFNPLAWWVLRMLRFERERACDDFVLSQGGKACDYAHQLLEIVKESSANHPALLAGTSMAGPRRLEKRILAILNDRINRKGLTMRNFMTVTTVTVLATLLLGTAGFQATSALAGKVPAAGVPEKANPDFGVLTANAQEEVDRYYKAAPKEVTDFVLWTEKQFKGTQWLPENAGKSMDAATREEMIKESVETLEERPYSRELCKALVMASVLRDKRLLPGLLKTAAYDELCDYDCCPKSMAVVALARQGDESAVPVLVTLVDHGNANTRMWARAALVRLTGQTFDQDKKAWGAWWNAQNKQPKLTDEDLKPWVAVQDRWRSESEPSKLPRNAQEEIDRYYQAAPQEVKDFVLWTEKEFRWSQWLPENSTEKMDAETREKAVERYVKILNEKPYSRELCPALTMASVLPDKRFLPGLLKVAAHHEPIDYDCGPKSMAVVALARQGDTSAVPVLIPLVDHGNPNTRMWARAALVRLTGQTFDQDKKAWGAWWNAQNKEPKLTDKDLKPWEPAVEKKAK
jgi:beta-lactamase regulating signal transducer with metallopeptidase domain